MLKEQRHLDRLYRPEDDHDLDFNGAVADDDVVEDAFALVEGAGRRGERVARVLDEADLGRVVPVRDGETSSIRDILVHMVEEYARHCGHADLLRECIDGRTGQ